MSPLTATLQRLGKPPRTASLIVTVWGDAVVPRGGSLWLGTLQAILDPFGCNEGQVRTAMSRLTEEGWLLRSRQGRLSFYRLGARGEASFAAAARRIYDPPRAGRPDWDGAFRLVLSADPAVAEALAGFVPLAPGLLVGTEGAPADLPPAAPALLARPRSAAEGVAIAVRAWPGLPEVASGYRRFAEAFAPLAGAALPEAEALPLRLLLVHEYRRVALRDPDLPAAVLPADWPRAEARAIAASVYRRLLPPSEAWLDAHGQGEDGPLPPAAPTELHSRFRDG
ncbi:PaaX family transcriptional regulator C-terminal domain-containing protein [Paracraurococcus lichenis]|uniref:PaaX family transcriptional regulator C-terminal domain-containing protein n=1 Tax=Paracraurococcus lichenis TaxID=3064888 RepID=A0ABT9E7F7_9PROT|nr:PaaX family transcriptional regulator C-terminal domain-containing protein [Paracraurococcus sp. LOR1-02]MDO9712131.1 PaaX family transcriptional regulator C-terminal domain-containing protein [Paracraurococcus sp. LOR1-02]